MKELLTMQIDLNLFHDAFFQESAEHLAAMEAALLQLERNPGDPELLNTIFRAAHSIKGASGTFGFAEVMRFTHAMETLLDRLRRGEIQATPARIDLLLRSGDLVRELLAAAASGAPAPADLSVRVEEALAEISSDHEGSVPAEPVAMPAAVPNSPIEDNGYRVYFRPAAEIFEQAMDPLLLLRDLCALDESAVVAVDLTHLPRLAELDPERCYLAWEVRLRTSKTPEDIRDIFAFVEDGAEVRIEAGGEPRDLARPVEKKGETVAPAGNAPPQRGEATLRVAASKVDKLIDLVGELVIAQSMANQILDNLTRRGWASCAKPWRRRSGISANCRNA
jgi:two-component system chemotaxis sensor kinase CheA